MQTCLTKAERPYQEITWCRFYSKHQLLLSRLNSNQSQKSITYQEVESINLCTEIMKFTSKSNMNFVLTCILLVFLAFAKLLTFSKIDLRFQFRSWLLMKSAVVVFVTISCFGSIKKTKRLLLYPVYWNFLPRQLVSHAVNWYSNSNCIQFVNIYYLSYSNEIYSHFNLPTVWLVPSWVQ